MNLKITKKAIKFCESLNPKQYKQVHSTIFGLLSNPTPHDSQQMRGGSGERRVDIGEYRIVYVVTDEVVDVLVIGNRNDDAVYKEWERLK